MSVAMLDITNNETVAWMGGRLDNLIKSLPSNEMTMVNKNSQLPNVAFFVDSGSFENLPAYFQVYTKRLISL